jgi:hypothetical protein
MQKQTIESIELGSNPGTTLPPCSGNFYLHFIGQRFLNLHPEKVASIAYWLDSSPSQPQLVRIIRLFFGPSISKHQL